MVPFPAIKITTILAAKPPLASTPRADLPWRVVGLAKTHRGHRTVVFVPCRCFKRFNLRAKSRLVLLFGCERFLGPREGRDCEILRERARQPGWDSVGPIRIRVARCEKAHKLGFEREREKLAYK